MQRQFLAAFSVTRVESEYRIENEKQFSQIAYDIRPMVWASLKAFEITGDNSYAKQAGELSSWFFGNNIAGKSLYNPNSGRCYDGINDQHTINKNSGAESTIEALLGNTFVFHILGLTKPDERCYGKSNFTWRL